MTMGWAEMLCARFLSKGLAPALVTSALLVPLAAQAGWCETLISRFISLSFFQSRARTPETPQWLDSIRIGDNVKMNVAQGKDLIGRVVHRSHNSVTLHDGGIRSRVPVHHIKRVEKWLPGILEYPLLVDRGKQHDWLHLSGGAEGSVKRGREQVAWEGAKALFAEDLKTFRSLPKAKARLYLDEVGFYVQNLLYRVLSVNNLGVHYNMHGGKSEDYLAAGGIEAGHPTINHLNHRDITPLALAPHYPEAYFYQTKHLPLHAILGLRHSDFPIFPRLRVGSLIVLFDLDSVVAQHKKKGSLVAHTPHSLSIRNSLTATQTDPANPHHQDRTTTNLVAIPLSAFLSPPLHVFPVARRTLEAQRLSWDEQTLAVLRFLECYFTLEFTDNPNP